MCCYMIIALNSDIYSKCFVDSLEANKGITNNNGSFFFLFWLVGEFEKKPCCREWGGFELLIFLL